MGNSKERVKVKAGARRERYSLQFKREAVRLLELGEQSAAEIARSLGIRRNMLYKWREQLAVSEAAVVRRAGRPRKEEESEVSRLKRELAKMTEERDILKKAAAYFAKDLK